ncbi:MAG: PQQ-binding-like beta-propeller repeat protein [Sedimentisphaeraceae bacterium JB056]
MRKFLVLGMLVSAVIIGGCSGTKKNIIAKDAGVDIIAPGLLSGAGLKLDWQNDLPLASNEKINHLIVAEKFVYVITDLNTVFCFERFEGKLRFIKQFARPSLPMMRPKEYEGALYTVVGDELWRLDPQTSSVKMVQKLVNSAVCPVVFTDDYIYVSGLDNRISCYDREGNWLKYQITADNDSKITSLIVEDEFMWFATEKGNIYNASAYEPTKYWAFNTTAKIVGDIVKDDKYLYISSLDTMVYKLSSVSGTLMWKAPLGSSLLKNPIVYDDYVYQQSSRNGLYALDTETGDVVWQEPEGVAFVARNGDDVYVCTEGELLSIMNNRTGKSEFKINFAPVDICGRNIYDDNIYVLSEEGKLAKISSK